MDYSLLIGIHYSDRRDNRRGPDKDNIPYGLSKHQKPALHSANIEKSPFVQQLATEDLGNKNKRSQRSLAGEEELEEEEDDEYEATDEETEEDMGGASAGGSGAIGGHGPGAPLEEISEDPDVLETGEQKSDEPPRRRAPSGDGGESELASPNRSARSSMASAHPQGQLSPLSAAGAGAVAGSADEAKLASPRKVMRTLSHLRRSSSFHREDGGIRSVHPDGVVGREIYYFGIIDFLQVYNGKKRAEHAWKVLVADGKAVSAVSPDYYARRFVDFVKAHIK
jgi:hypothetical protein